MNARRKPQNRARCNATLSACGGGVVRRGQKRSWRPWRPRARASRSGVMQPHPTPNELQPHSPSHRRSVAALARKYFPQ
jgi:hypothetical protein